MGKQPLLHLFYSTDKLTLLLDLDECHSAAFLMQTDRANRARSSTQEEETSAGIKAGSPDFYVRFEI